MNAGAFSLVNEFGMQILSGGTTQLVSVKEVQPLFALIKYCSTQMYIYIALVL